MRCSYLVVTLVLAATSVSYAQVTKSRDETAIREQLTAYAEARQRGDGRAQALFYTEDADIWLSSTRKLSRGRVEIERALDHPSDPNRRFRLEIENLGFLRPDVAFVDAQVYGRESEPTGHAFYVMVKRDGKWLIRATRTARFVSAAR
jgi:uncharacterized protein (TIGR02246 family)